MNDRVFVTACDNYENALEPALDRIMEMTGWLADPTLAGRRVLVKPNLLTDRVP